MSTGHRHHEAPPPGAALLPVRTVHPKTPRWIALALIVVAAAGTIGPLLVPPTASGRQVAAAVTPADLVKAGPFVAEPGTPGSGQVTVDPAPARTPPVASPRVRRERVAHASRSRLLASPDFAALAQCESGGDPTAVSPSGRYRGWFQFDGETWRSVGGKGDPAAASPAEQTYRARLLYAQRGRSPWPYCGRFL